MPLATILSIVWDHGGATDGQATAAIVPCRTGDLGPVSHGPSTGPSGRELIAYAMRQRGSLPLPRAVAVAACERAVDARGRMDPLHWPHIKTSAGAE